MGFFSRFSSKLKSGLFFQFAKSEYMPSGNLRDSEIVGSVADCIAKNVGKLQPCVVSNGKNMSQKGSQIESLLRCRPCPECSSYDFLYRMASDVIYNSNAYAVIFYNSDYTRIERIQPITVSGSPTFYEDEQGRIFFKFRWEYDNKEYVVPYQFLIHIKGRYNRKRFMGTPPNTDLKTSIELLDTTYNGIKNIVKNSSTLRGYLKFNNLMNDDDVTAKVKDFKEAFMNSEENGGIAGLDSTVDYKDLNQQARPIPTATVNFFRENIYRYYGVNEGILTSKFSESEWNAFYEEVIEPFEMQLSLEFTFKLFTERERGCGNKIIFVSNQLQYASLATRASIGKEMFDRGAIMLDEYRELLYYAPLPNGEGQVRMISLNYVKSTDQSLYQTGQNQASNDANEVVSFISNKLAELENVRGGE